jgi:NhaA family Na+:H+ antiporter
MAGPEPRPDRASPAERVLIAPLRNFLHTEAAGGVVLVAATAVALVWANSPWQDSYVTLWHTQLSISVGNRSIDLDLREWVNEGLMAIFFLVVGLEIKRELVEGELREPRRAALPAIAALGGMLVPAVIYLAVNAGGRGSHGWGIPMATDIAMAVGVVSLLGRRVSASLKLFLLALAIADDIGAIVVIAVFYTDGVSVRALEVALVLVAAVAVMRKVGVVAIPAYVVVGAALWLALYESGVHATLTGVVLGLMAPTQPIRQHQLIDETALTDLSTVEAARETAVLARESVSVVEWLEHLLHPWSSFLIVPLFALANAGVPLSSSALSDAARSPITYGVVLGLVLGKLIGIAGFTWLATRSRIGMLPEGATWQGLLGVAALGGIGFTVSIFVAGLAFDDPVLQNDAKIGILIASVVAATLGSLILLGRRPGGTDGRGGDRQSSIGRRPVETGGHQGESRHGVA